MRKRFSMKIIRTDSIVEIVFNNLSSKNSFDLESAERWCNEVTSQTTKLMILRSEGSVFCSGGDLLSYASLATKNEGVILNRKIRDCLAAISAIPCAKFAFVSGDCWGGGLEVLSVCDKIYSLNHVFFGLWQSRMNLSFGWGGFERLSRRIDPTELCLWLSEGATRSAFKCEHIGLVDQLISPQTMSKKIMSLKNTFNGPKAIYFSNEFLANQNHFFDELWWSKDHQKALFNFKNKSSS